MAEKERANAPSHCSFYSLGEEIANSITHGIGAGMSIAGLTALVLLAALQRDHYRIMSFSIYGGSLITLYLASTLYHSFQHPRAKAVFQRIDHACIYLLIAGTYTPFILLSRQEGTGRLLGAVWAIALLGACFEALFIQRFRRFSVAAYLGFAWLGAAAGRSLLAQIPPGGLYWLIAGGVAYTLGVVFYAWRRLPYNHAIWHLFVLSGSACHFLAVLLYGLPS